MTLLEHPPADVSTDARPSPRSGAEVTRRADIQGLRAVAVILVVAFHAGLPVSGGFVGVDVFFVISGFVISMMLLRELERTDRISLTEFFTRRFRRLLPALSLMIVIVVAMAAFLLSPFGPQAATARTGTAASLLSANLQLLHAGGGGYFDLAANNNALLHTWSLSVEEQFYLVFPALLLLGWRRVRRTARPEVSLGVFVTAASVASFALCVVTTSRGPGSWGSEFAFYSPFTRVWEFGVGILLALGVPTLARRTGVWAGRLALTGAALVGWAAWTFSDVTQFPGFAAAVPVAGTALLLVAGMTPGNTVSRALSTRPLVRIGDVSYGWYLWHWPLIVFAIALWPHDPAATIVAAGLAYGLAVLSARFVERPLRVDRTLVGRRLVVLVAGCITVPVVACTLLPSGGRLEWRVPAVAAYMAVAQSHGEPGPCDSEQPIGGPAATACVRTVVDPKGTVVLVGDSNAGQFTEPVARAANALGYDYVTSTMGGCAFAEVLRETRLPAFDGQRCLRTVRASEAAIVRQKPALVVIAASSSQLLAGGLDLADPMVRRGTRLWASTQSARARVYERGLAGVLAKLGAAGVPTLVVHPVPHLGDSAEDWQGSTCPFVRIALGSCGATISRADVERQQRRARTAEEHAVAAAPLSSAVDFTEALCSAAACSSSRGDVWLYRDGAHLSVDGALTLTDRFRALIAERGSP